MEGKSIIKACLQPAFVLCVVILAGGATVKTVLIKGVGGYLKKQPLPLKKSLDLLDEEQLLPYKVINKRKEVYEDVVESLGTEDYIMWTLEDQTKPVNSPVLKCLLFITYYDLPDLVPHTPEVCYVGGGNRLLRAESLSVKIKTKDFDKEIPIKYLIFGNRNSEFPDSEVEFPVMYCFYVNGHYGNSRADTRYYLNKYFFHKYSFFSKVEWLFFNNTEFGSQFFPDKEDAVEASQALLTVLLPILETEHWPDWNR